MIGRGDQTMNSVLAMDRPERRDRDDRRAIRIGDDALVSERRLRIDLGNDERNRRVHAKRATNYRRRSPPLSRRSARNFWKCFPPAEKRRSARLAKLFFREFLDAIAALERKLFRLSSEREPETHSVSGKMTLFEVQRRNSTPTAPVAPTTATVHFFFVIEGDIVADGHSFCQERLGT